MLKLKLLAAATAAALFAAGGAIAQTGKASTDKAPTAPAGPKEAGGSAPSFSAIDKNNDGQISREEWNNYHRGAAAKARTPKDTSASGGTASGTTSDKKAPSATTGPRDVGGSDKARAGGGSAGETSGAGAGASSPSAGASTDKAPTAPGGPKEAGGTDKPTTSK